MGFSILAAAAQGADNPFVRPEAINGPKLPPCNYAFPSKVPVRCWTNQKIFILPLPLSEQHSSGYVYIRRAGSGLSPTYKEIAGKIATVTSVRIPDNAGDTGSPEGKLTFVVDGTKQRYTTRIEYLTEDAADIDGGYVSDVALFRDLQSARSTYLGKSYWLLQSSMTSLAADAAGQTDFVDFHKFGKITITDVLASNRGNMSPVRLVSKNEKGQEGFVDIAPSPTNGEHDSATSMFSPDRYISTADPKLVHHWPPRVWTALDAGDVFVGMTPEQARMSWFEPTKIGRSQNGGHPHEVWTYYDGGTLTFDTNVLTAIHKGSH